MDSVKIIHEAAMEYYDLARRAKSKGDTETWKDYITKAYVLEKEAALTMPEQPKNYMWRYILLRSAAWLAYQSGAYKEAVSLAQLGLAGKPPSIEKNKLTQLLTKIRQKTNYQINSLQEKNQTQISGLLSSVDLLKGNIHISQPGTGQQTYIKVANEKIREIARLFIGDLVQILIKENIEGVKYLEDIKRAA